MSCEKMTMYLHCMTGNMIARSKTKCQHYNYYTHEKKSQMPVKTKYLHCSWSMRPIQTQNKNQQHIQDRQTKQLMNMFRQDK
jgi:hypothetical protein